MSDEVETNEDGEVLSLIQAAPAGSQLVAAVCKVMDEVGYIKKGGRNDNQRYTYASDADLLNKLQPAMAANGLMIAPCRVQPILDKGKSSRGGEVCQATLVVTYRLSHISGEVVTVESVGQGWDSLDKATNKAMTGAFKYVLRQTFAIPTGDDPEKPSKLEEEEQPAKRQEEPKAALQKHWFARLRKLKADGLIPELSDDDRHKVQAFFFEGKPSLKSVFPEEAAVHLQKMRATNDATLGGLIRDQLGISQ